MGNPRKAFERSLRQAGWGRDALKWSNLLVAASENLYELGRSMSKPHAFVTFLDNPPALDDTAETRQHNREMKQRRKDIIEKVQEAEKLSAQALEMLQDYNEFANR